MNLALYNANAYKVIHSDNLMDLGFTEEKICKNGKAVTRKAKSKLE